MEIKNEKNIITQIRFIDSITNEFERRNKLIKPDLEICESIEKAESIILNHVKFVGRILEVLRRENKIMKENLGQNYAKLIGLASPYEQVIHKLRDTKNELDMYLKIIREKIVTNIKKQNNNFKKNRKVKHYEY